MGPTAVFITILIVRDEGERRKTIEIGSGLNKKEEQYISRKRGSFECYRMNKNLANALYTPRFRREARKEEGADLEGHKSAQIGQTA